MKKRARMRRTLLAAIASACGALGGCDSGVDRPQGGAQTDGGPWGEGGAGTTCRLVGCGPIWAVKRALPTPLAVSEIQQLHLEVCRNDWCFADGFANFVPAEPFMMGGGLGKTLPRKGDGDPVIEVTFWGTDEGNAGQVEVSWRLGDRDGAAGDVFSFDLLRPGVMSILSVEETVDYEVYHPNGTACSPQCQQAISR